jgi:hypothetical protein
MDALESAIWFLGDLGDPWVVSIADSLPACWDVKRAGCTGDLPERLCGSAHRPRLVIVHRHRLSALDCERLRGWRDRDAIDECPSLMLCVSPYLRYEELERASGLVDRVLSEATAPDVLPGHVRRLLATREARERRAGGLEFRIEVAGGTEDLVRTLVDACTAKGYRAVQVADLGIAAAARAAGAGGGTDERVLTIWEVPVLESSWPERLAQRARAAGPVIALLGFADRASVSLAKARGAVACLDLPCDIDELSDAISRVAERQPVDLWPLPARAERPHLLPPRSRRRAPARGAQAAGPVWSGGEERPTITGTPPAREG